MKHNLINHFAQYNHGEDYVADISIATNTSIIDIEQKFQIFNKQVVEYAIKFSQLGCFSQEVSDEFEEIRRNNPTGLTQKTHEFKDKEGAKLLFKSNPKAYKLYKKFLDAAKKADKQKKRKEIVSKMKQKALAAFVTFDYTSIKDSFEDRVDVNWARACFFCCKCCQKHPAYFNGKTLKASVPSEPENMMWENLHISEASRTCRKVFSWVLSLFIIGTLVVLVVLISKQSKNRSERRVSCREDEYYKPTDETFIEMALKDYVSEKSEGVMQCFCIKRYMKIGTEYVWFTQRVHVAKRRKGTDLLEDLQQLLCGHWHRRDHVLLPLGLLVPGQLAAHK